MKRLEQKINAAKSAESKFKFATDAIGSELQKLTGYENITVQHFVDDGFGVSTMDEARVFTPIDHILNILESKGKLTREDLDSNPCL